MKRDQLAAFARGAFTLAIGGAVLYAIGRWLGWWYVAGIFAVAIGDAVWCTWRLARQLGPTWRMW